MLLDGFFYKEVYVVTFKSQEWMEVFVSFSHYVLQETIVLEICEIGLCPKKKVAWCNIADMPAIGIGNKFIVLHTINIFIFRVEFRNDMSILRSKRLKPSRNNSNNKVIGGLDSFSEQYGKLLSIVIEKKLHIV